MASMVMILVPVHVIIKGVYLPHLKHISEVMLQR